MLKLIHEIDSSLVSKKSRNHRVEIHQMKKQPEIPLTEMEKELLRKDIGTECVKIYSYQFQSFLNEDENLEDLKAEAWLGFEEMLIKFDKKRMSEGSELNQAFIGTWVQTIKFHKNKTIAKTRKAKEDYFY